MTLWGRTWFVVAVIVRGGCMMVALFFFWFWFWFTWFTGTFGQSANTVFSSLFSNDFSGTAVSATTVAGIVTGVVAGIGLL